MLDQKCKEFIEIVKKNKTLFEKENRGISRSLLDEHVRADMRFVIERMSKEEFGEIGKSFSEMDMEYVKSTLNEFSGKGSARRVKKIQSWSYNLNLSYNIYNYIYHNNPDSFNAIKISFAENTFEYAQENMYLFSEFVKSSSAESLSFFSISTLSAGKLAYIIDTNTILEKLSASDNLIEYAFSPTTLSFLNFEEKILVYNHAKNKMNDGEGKSSIIIKSLISLIPYDSKYKDMLFDYLVSNCDKYPLHICDDGNATYCISMIYKKIASMSSEEKFNLVLDIIENANPDSYESSEVIFEVYNSVLNSISKKEMPLFAVPLKKLNPSFNMFEKKCRPQR